jgi:hypothetical protein
MSQSSEDLRYFLTRFADDKPFPERARLVAGILLGGQKRFEQMGANLCEGATLLARQLHLPDAVALALGQLLERWTARACPEKPPAWRSRARCESSGSPRICWRSLGRATQMR